VPTLSVSIVTYFSDANQFKSTCAALFAAIAHARTHAALTHASLALIDNTEDGSDAQVLFKDISSPAAKIEILSGHGNVGYGSAHNLSLLKSKADLHLVLNPDITMKRDALTNAINLLAVRNDAVCLTPNAVGADGKFTSLCKRRASVRLLAVRAFAPRFLKEKNKNMIDAYEYVGELGDAPMPIYTASGAFMLVRRRIAQKVRGFDERFFLHFEDIDFSLRLHAHGQILFAPQVQVVHYGGNASKKHLWFLLANAFRYFWKWGFGDPLARK
jgi:GT2 family glycosyltransferase